MLAPDMVMQGRYRIISQVGKGGMGTVYLAGDENLNVNVALKQSILDDQRLIEAFKREAHLLAGLRHSALPQVKDYFVNESGQFLVMEYISGDDFGAILEKRQQKIPPVGVPKPFEFQEVLPWAEQLLDALDYLHTLPEPVVHRDIKPQNLKLAARNQIILLDFGLAKGKSVSATQMTTGSIYGYTPNYAPLEQIRGIGTDPRSDLYALGATLYHLLTGFPPADAATRADAVIGGEPDPLLAIDQINPQIPRAMADVLMKAMAPHRNQRPASAAEMLELLRPAKFATVVDLRSPEASHPPRKTSPVAADPTVWPSEEVETHKRNDAEPQNKREGIPPIRLEAETHPNEANRRALDAAALPSPPEPAERERPVAGGTEVVRPGKQSPEGAQQNWWQAAEQRAQEAGQQGGHNPGYPVPRTERWHKPANDAALAESKPAPGRGRKIIIWLVAIIVIGGGLLIPVAWMVKTKLFKSKIFNSHITYNQTLPTTGPVGELLRNFVQIPAGEFVMGSEHGDSDEKPLHRVRISQNFEMGKYEVTQAQWEAMMNNNPSQHKGANLPVEYVSWDDVQEFIKKLNDQDNHHLYRLPTEAEWEYACRAGDNRDEVENLDAVAWYDKNSGNQSHPVGQKQPNNWGLYDMHGNIYEWCQDNYTNTYYAASPNVDPQGPSSGTGRVERGGSFTSPASLARSTHRGFWPPNSHYNYLGFRLLRTSY